LPYIEFALNTSVCRTIGMPPFTALHGFRARLPLDQALGVNVAPDIEPLEHVASIASGLLHRRISAAERKAFEAEKRQYLRDAHGVTRFHTGDYVLVHMDPDSKLDHSWQGPFTVVDDSRADDFVYEVENVGKPDQRLICHVNRLHPFLAGTLDRDALRKEALRADEYLIESVHTHAYDRTNGELWLSVVWLGYPDYTPQDRRSWVKFADSHWSPAVTAYVTSHALPTTISLPLPSSVPIAPDFIYELSAPAPPAPRKKSTGRKKSKARVG